MLCVFTCAIHHWFVSSILSHNLSCKSFFFFFYSTIYHPIKQRNKLTTMSPSVAVYFQCTYTLRKAAQIQIILYHWMTSSGLQWYIKIYLFPFNYFSVILDSVQSTSNLEAYLHTSDWKLLRHNTETWCFDWKLIYLAPPLDCRDRCMTGSCLFQGLSIRLASAHQISEKLFSPSSFSENTLLLELWQSSFQLYSYQHL